MIHTSKAFEDKQKSKARRIMGMPVAVFAALAVLVTGGVAWAAIAFSFTGSVQAEADNGVAPTVSNEHFSGKFYPGAERDLIFTVTNSNEFPVTLTKVSAASASDFKGGCEGGQNLVSTVLDTKGEVTLKKPVVVPANGKADVTIEKAVKLSADATAGCSFKVVFKVTGTGAGN